MEKSNTLDDITKTILVLWLVVAKANSAVKIKLKLFVMTLKKKLSTRNSITVI